MSIEETQKKLNQFFIEKLAIYGATPKGVDWLGREAQEIRFEQLVKVIDPSQKFTLIDYGCGYGALFDFLARKGWDFEYYGVDLIEDMAQAGRETHKDFPNAHFTTDEKEAPVADYLLASGIFNVKIDASYENWQAFVLQTLKNMDALCTKGFSFNMLTKYSDTDRMAERPDLFFADPLFFFDFCKRNFSRNVALLHDYGIYDFAILVRKDI
jgi:SAM-dependent methyltransferase